MCDYKAVGTYMPPHAINLQCPLPSFILSLLIPYLFSFTHIQDADATLLYRSLRLMFEQAERFGGSLFAMAASVTTDLLHHEPLSYRALEAEGLPAAFISAVKVSRGVTCFRVRARS